jgi:exosortase F-associated protein
MKIATVMPRPSWAIRISLFLIAVSILVFTYVFQHVGFAGFIGLKRDVHPNIVFATNRALRMILNDMACFILIYLFFEEKKYLKLAFLVFLVEFLVVLPIYLVIKLSLEGDSEISSPLLSQIHRLIVNPTLMILLMLGFFYQKYRKKPVQS